MEKKSLGSSSFTTVQLASMYLPIFHTSFIIGSTIFAKLKIKSYAECLCKGILVRTKRMANTENWYGVFMLIIVFPITGFSKIKVCCFLY